MGWVPRSSPGAAVSEAGGLEVIAAAHGNPALLRDEIHRVRDLTEKPRGVDILIATIRAAGNEVECFTDQVKEWIELANVRSQELHHVGEVYNSEFASAGFAQKCVERRTFQSWRRNCVSISGFEWVQKGAP